MRKWIAVCLVIASLSLVGCDNAKNEKLQEDIKRISAALSDGVERADAPATAIEGATGFDGFDQSKLDKVAARLKQTEKYAGQANKALLAAKVLLGSSNPYVGTGVAIASGLSALAGVLSAFVSNRKKKRAEAVAVAVMTGVNKIPLVGEKINSATMAAGVTNEAQALYQKHIAD